MKLEILDNSTSLHSQHQLLKQQALPTFFLLLNYYWYRLNLQGSPVISAMLNSSAPFIVQNWPGMEWIELSCSKIAWIIVLKSPDYCSI